MSMMFRNALAPAARRTTLVSTSRSFHTSPAARKSATEKVAEVADKVNKSVGRGLASAIEKGEEATGTTKHAVGTATEKSKEAAGVAGQKANQTAAGAREGAKDFKQDIQKEARK